jgi:hypothetical protein
MAIINALKTGNWSDTTVWPGGTLPGPTDQVQANGYIITIDQDITVASIRTTAEGGGAAGGYYTTENGRTITADIVCGGGYGINISNATYTVIGNIYASTTGDYEPIRTNSTQISTITIIGNVVASYGYGIYNIGIADIIVVGNVTGGINANKHGIFNNSTGSVTVTGNVTGGSGSSAHGIHNLSTGSVTVTGNVTGGSGSSAIGVNNHAGGTITVTGNATGGAVGTGIQNNTGTLSVTGNAIASLYIRGITSGGAGPIDLIGTAIGNDWKFGDPGSVMEGIYGQPNASIFRLVTVSAIKYGAYGSPPTSGNVFIKKTATSTATMTDNDGNLVTLVTSDSICDFPAVSNVRLNTAFDNSNKVGTCAVPAAAAVSQGVAVDHTVGTAILTAANVRSSLGMAAADMDTQLDAIYAVASASTGGGVNKITVTVDDGTTPVQDVDVHVYDSTNALWITSGSTNSSGQCEFYLDDGTYKVRLRKSGASFTNPETLTVSGDTPKTFHGSMVVIGVPDDSDTCRVYEYCFDQAGKNPLSSCVGTAIIKNVPYDYDDKLHSSGSVTGTYDSTTGLLYWNIVKGATVLFMISGIGINQRKTIPTTTTARLSDI